mgnify:CR=1 FL=1
MTTTIWQTHEYIRLSAGFVEEMMRYRRRIFIEKLALQLAAGACLACVFFLVAPRCVGADPLAGIIFSLGRNWQRVALAVGSLWALSALAGVGLAFVRPQGAMLVPLAAMSGLCLRSASLRPWLWEYGEHLQHLYMSMVFEVLAGAMVVFVAGCILDGARRWATDNGWSPLWQEPFEGEEADGVNITHVGPDHQFLGLFAGIGQTIRGLTGRGNATEAKQARSTVIGLVLSVAVGLVLTVILLKSPLRGQVVFAVFAAFLLATWIVQYVSPMRAMAAILLSPILGGLVFYALASFSLRGVTGPQSWLSVKLYAQPLPIDWLLAGTAGAMVGAWVSHRMIETSYMEKVVEDGQDTKESINE